VRAASYSAGVAVAEGFVQAFLVVPGHPFGRREFDVVDASPGLAPGDQLGLVRRVDRLGEGVVITIAPRPDRGRDPQFGQKLPDVQARLAGPPGLSPHPRIDRGPPKHCRRRAGCQSLDRTPNRLEHQEIRAYHTPLPYRQNQSWHPDPHRRTVHDRIDASLACSMIGGVRMRNLRYACGAVTLDGVLGDFIETGVWRGRHRL
jgi:hypothetical protein